jgi:hypothetical protein
MDKKPVIGMVVVLKDDSHAQVVNVTPKSVDYRVRRGLRGRFGSEVHRVSRAGFEEIVRAIKSVPTDKPVRQTKAA